MLHPRQEDKSLASPKSMLSGPRSTAPTPPPLLQLPGANSTAQRRENSTGQCKQPEACGVSCPCLSALEYLRSGSV